MALRVAQAVRSDSFAGVERSVVLLSNGLVDSGLQVTVIGGDKARMLTSLDGRVTFLPASSTLAVAQALMRARPFDIVHAHMTAAETAAVVTKRVVRAPIVSTRHFVGTRGSGLIGGALRRLIGRSVTIQIAVSDYVASTIGEPSRTILHGVQDRPSGDLAAGTVLVVQRLEVEKSTDVALRAWATSGLSDKGWRLVVAGTGSQRDSLLALVRRLGVSESVSFVGFVGDVPRLMGTAAMMIASAPAEPFGYAVVEAMAAGLPVIAADAGGHKETIGQAVPELLFTPGDVDACAALLRRLANEPALSRGAAKRLQAYQRERLGLAREVREVAALYDEILSRPMRGRRT